MGNSVASVYRHAPRGDNRAESRGAFRAGKKRGLVSGNAANEANAAAVEIAKATMRALMLVHGAAATAVLAVIGNLAVNEVPIPKLLLSSVVIFGFGVIMALAVMWIAYQSQLAFARGIAAQLQSEKEAELRLHRQANMAGALLGGACVLLVGTGIFFATIGFNQI